MTQWGMRDDVPVAGDYNGDGRVELVVWRPANGTWWNRTTGQVTQWGMAGDVPVPGDYDGNGKLEIAIWRPANGTWWNRDLGQVIQWGVAGDVPVPADYNGDGRTDVAVWRPSNGTWWDRDAGRVTQWGMNGDVPVPGDYDGDGRLELAIFRPSTGTWWNRDLGQLIAWGVWGDIPVPADYNGDGRTDVAVWRPSNGTWWNRDMGQVTQWGQAGDTPRMLPILPRATSRDATPPSPATGLRKSGATQTTITLAWNAATDNVGVAGYNLFKNGAKVDSTTQLTYTYAGLVCGTTYTLGVQTFDAAANVSDLASAISVESTAACPVDTTPPSAPSALEAAVSTQTSVSLSWSASTDDVAVTGYDVYVNGTLAARVPGTSYTAAGLACGTTYTFAVDAGDAAGNRSAKATTSATTAACAVPPPIAASVFVSPSGSDANACTQVAPCSSFDRAYRVAAPGEAVEIADGSYPAQTVRADPAKTGPDVVTFRPALGATVTVSDLDVDDGASYLTFADISATRGIQVQNSDYTAPGSTNVTFESMTAATVRIIGRVSNITIRGGSFGGTVDNQPQVKKYNRSDPDSSRPSDIVVDGAFFHDYKRSDPSVHTECLQIMNADGLTIRNSRFNNCDGTGGIGMTDGPIDNVTIENNFFGSAGDAFHAVQITRSVRNLLLRYNSSAKAFVFSDTEVGGPYAFVGNYVPFNATTCTTDATYSHNVFAGGGCGPTDVNVPALRFVDEAGFDLHLAPGSEAVDAGDPTNTPSSDIDGEARPRGSAPDAGADEAA